MKRDAVKEISVDNETSISKENRTESNQKTLTNCFSLSNSYISSVDSDIKNENVSSNTVGVYLLNQLNCHQIQHLNRQATAWLSSMVSKMKGSGSMKFANPMFLYNHLKKICTSQKEEQIPAGIFGVSLATCSQRFGTLAPPSILRILEHLSLTACNSVGLFRRSGNTANVNRLKGMLNDEAERSGFFTSDVDFTFANEYDLADVVKKYVHELPESILTAEAVDLLLDLFRLLPESDLISVFQYIVRMIPEGNRDFLQLLLQFFHKLSDLSQKNQMSIQSIATCWAPALFKVDTTSNDGTSFSSLIFSICNVSGSKNCPSPCGKHKSSHHANLGKVDSKKLERYMDSISCLRVLIESYLMIFSVKESELLTEHTAPPTFNIFSNSRKSDGMWSDCKNFGDEQMLEYAIHIKKELLKSVSDVFDEVIAGFPTWNALPELFPDMKLFMHEFSANDSNAPLGSIFMGETNISMPAEEILRTIVCKQNSWDPDTRECIRITRMDHSTEIYYHQISLAGTIFTKDFILIRLCSTSETKNGDNKIYATMSSSLELDSKTIKMITPNSNTHKLVKLLMAPSSERRQRGKIYTERYIVQNAGISASNNSIVRLALCCDIGGKAEAFYRNFTPLLISKRLQALKKFCESRTLPS